MKEWRITPLILNFSSRQSTSHPGCFHLLVRIPVVITHESAWAPDISENRKFVSPAGVRNMIPWLPVNRLYLYSFFVQCYKAYCPTHPLAAQNPPAHIVICWCNYEETSKQLPIKAACCRHATFSLSYEHNKINTG